MSGRGRLVVVSNRIPTDATPSGGLVVALHEALKARGGLWIGSSGSCSSEDRGLREIADGAYRRLAFDLSEAEHAGFYLGYANSVLWPLFHRRADLIEMQAREREVYLAVNDRVAELIAGVIGPDDDLWIHDYHFLPLAHALRRLGVGNRIGFFLHIPFPASSDIPALPDREALAGWLAAFDLVGLQTKRDVVSCLDYFRRETMSEMTPRGALRIGEREVEVRSFPIGIDVGAFRTAAEQAAPTGLPLAPGSKLVLGVDRLDYSKGLPHRFEAFGTFLDSRADPSDRATLVQIAPPSREDVEAYQQIRQELESLAGSINGAHAELDWTPIRYLRRPLPRDRLAALYRQADAMMVTPLADGMNLVAKEFVAAQDPADPGVLILSHFAGAAEQLDGALLVNPYDTESVAEALGTALAMPLTERTDRYRSMIGTIEAQDIHWWTETYLKVLRQAPPLAA